MNCAWCGANADGSGSHGICDDCMLSFGVNPVSIHQEIAEEEAVAAVSQDQQVEVAA